jgi:periplasmic protein CpxP/Spy
MSLPRFMRFVIPMAAVTAGMLLFAGCHRDHCRRGGTPEEKAEKITKRIAKELKLTQDQKGKLEKIKGDILARKADFQAMHGGLRDLALGQIRSESVDQDALNRNLEDREAKMKELRSFMVAEFAEFHAMLDPAQREKLAGHLERHCR